MLALAQPLLRMTMVSTNVILVLITFAELRHFAKQSAYMGLSSKLPVPACPCVCVCACACVCVRACVRVARVCPSLSAAWLLLRLATHDGQSCRQRYCQSPVTNV